MQQDWFPEVGAHVFLSHSSKDKDNAITLAGYLYHKFNIITFIDSCIWGHSNDLLKILDKKYSLLENDNATYNYDKRNRSTSHIHMMLSSALTMMIDKAECLIFLNTPNSVSTKQACSTTGSPWIYSEITTSRFIHKRIPIRHRKIQLSKNIKTFDSLDIQYPLSTSHLSNINSTDFIEWFNKSTCENYEDALDSFYKTFKRMES